MVSGWSTRRDSLLDDLGAVIDPTLESSAFDGVDGFLFVLRVRTFEAEASVMIEEASERLEAAGSKDDPSLLAALRRVRVLGFVITGAGSSSFTTAL